MNPNGSRKRGRAATGMVALALVAALAVPSVAVAQDDSGPVKIGGLATLEGPFAVPGQDAFRGMELALDEFKNADGVWEVAGREIQFLKE